MKAIAKFRVDSRGLLNCVPVREAVVDQHGTIAVADAISDGDQKPERDEDTRIHRHMLRQLA